MHQTSIFCQDVANSKHSKGFTEPYKYKWMASSLKKLLGWKAGNDDTFLPVLAYIPTRGRPCKHLIFELRVIYYLRKVKQEK